MDNTLIQWISLKVDLMCFDIVNFYLKVTNTNKSIFNQVKFILTLESNKKIKIKYCIFIVIVSDDKLIFHSPTAADSFFSLAANIAVKFRI